MLKVAQKSAPQKSKVVSAVEGQVRTVGSLPGTAESLSLKVLAMGLFRGAYEAGVANRIPLTRN